MENFLILKSKIDKHSNCPRPTPDFHNNNYLKTQNKRDALIIEQQKKDNNSNFEMITTKFK